MKRVVGLLHRQAVRVKAEGLFFQASGSTCHKVVRRECNYNFAIGHDAGALQ